MNKAGTGFDFNSPQNLAALNWFVRYDKAGIFKLELAAGRRLGRTGLRRGRSRNGH